MHQYDVMWLTQGGMRKLDLEHTGQVKRFTKLLKNCARGESEVNSNELVCVKCRNLCIFEAIIVRLFLNKMIETTQRLRVYKGIIIVKF